MKKTLCWSLGSLAGCIILMSMWSCARYQYYSPPQQPVAPAPSPSVPVAAPSPVVKKPAEVRAVWVSNTMQLDWARAAQTLPQAGFNTMYVNLASGGAAFYPDSKWLPSLANGSRADFARQIANAQRAGVAVHAKIIVLFMFRAPPVHQQQLVAANRVMRGPHGRPVTQAGFTWLCPSNADNRALIHGVIEEMLTTYRFDGLQFDYIRLYEDPSCYCGTCRREFERHIGNQVADWPRAVTGGGHTLRFNQWRQDLIHDWVRTMTWVARKSHPNLPVSAAVFSDLDRARSEKSQDWKLWLERGYVDYVCTMTYTMDSSQFESLIRKQQEWAPRRDQVVVGIGSWKMTQMSQLTGQIDTVRRLGAPGFALFSYDDAVERNFLPRLGAP